MRNLFEMDPDASGMDEEVDPLGTGGDDDLSNTPASDDE